MPKSHIVNQLIVVINKDQTPYSTFPKVDNNCGVVRSMITGPINLKENEIRICFIISRFLKFICRNIFLFAHATAPGLTATSALRRFSMDVTNSASNPAKPS